VFLSERIAPFSDTLLTAEHLLHETSHLRLTLVMEENPIIASASDVLVESPWRLDPRPVHQIVHGSFVFVRIIQFMQRILSLRADLAAEQRRDQALSELRAALKTLRESDTSFTARGEELVEQFHAVAHERTA
jgi:HEXXH motif-containing protein